jgi:C-terminal domain 10 of the ABC-three component (ABC-3C) systems
LAIRIWPPDKLWREVVGQLEMEQLNQLFPGAPGITHLELSDMTPLLDVLSEPADIDQAGEILPVPVEKMDFNHLSPITRLEFNWGRRLAPRIDQWFIENGDPSLRDAQGDTFRKIYQSHKRVTSDPSEIIERLYVSLAGPNVRVDGKRANAAYAVTSYFFDSCHIFEDPSSEVISSKENVLA